MKKTVYLHVGLPKTATSSIQHFGHHNRRALWWRGLTYPVLPGAAVAHHGIGWSLRGQTERFPPGPTLDTDSILDATAAAVRKSVPRRVLISSETLSGLKPEPIGRLLDALAGFDVRVIAMVRRPDRLCVSQYNQNIKSPTAPFALDFEDGLRHFLARGNLYFDRKLGPWVDALGADRVTLLQFEDGDPMKAVYAAAGLPAHRLPEADKVRNSSVPAVLCSILALAKRRGLPPEVLRRLQVAGRKVFKDHPHHRLSRSEAETIFAACRDDNDRFFARFGRDNPYRAEDLDLPDDDRVDRPDPAEVQPLLDELLSRIEAVPQP